MAVVVIVNSKWYQGKYGGKKLRGREKQNMLWDITNSLGRNTIN